MSTNISALDSKSIRTAEFVRLTTTNQGAIAMSNLPFPLTVTTGVPGTSTTISFNLSLANGSNNWFRGDSTPRNITFTNVDGITNGTVITPPATPTFAQFASSSVAVDNFVAALNANASFSATWVASKTNATASGATLLLTKISSGPITNSNVSLNLVSGQSAGQPSPVISGPVVAQGTQGTGSTINFNSLGSLLTVSNIQRDLKSTSNDISVSFTGIDPNAVAIILDAKVKGSKLEIWRGFFDSNYNLITSPSQQFFSRFVGYVTNVSINEEFNAEANMRLATATVSCSSFRSILENSQSGIRTNPNFWKQRYANDTSFDRTPLIENTAFDFGKPPQSGGNADNANGAANTEVNTELVVDRY